MKISANLIEQPKQFTPIKVTIEVTTQREADLLKAIVEDSNQLRTFVNTNRGSLNGLFCKEEIDEFTHLMYLLSTI